MEFTYNKTPNTDDTKRHPNVRRRYSEKKQHFDMMKLHLYGVKYKQIALATGYSYSWVKHLFARGGKVKEMLNALANKAPKELPRDHRWMAGYKEVTDEEWLDFCNGQSEAVDDFYK